MSRSKFYDKIRLASIEREIEDIYNEGLALYFNNTTITHPFACDGLIDTKEQGKLCKLIMEYKYDKDFKNAVSRAGVIVQVLYYIKRFEENGLILPNICLVGDINECFVFHTNDIQKYLSYDLDWSIAPSGAHVQNPELVLEIAKDEVINPFIFNIDENFSFKDVADKIKDLAVNVKRLVNVTEHNIAVIYEYFCNNVVKEAKSIPSNDLVAVFVNSITDRDSTFLHPKKKDVLVSCGREIHIHSNAYNSFFSYFNKNYTPQEKSNFSKISDRLIEDTNRRNKGEFYTPTTFVDKAHRMIEKALGEDWKEKYVVWDNCCYDEETEFLTPNGWKFMKDYTDGDLVMQYNIDGSGCFVKPLRYLNHPYDGEWVLFESSQVDIKTTSEHDYVVKSDKGGGWYKNKAIEVYEKSQQVKNLHLVIPVSFNYNGNVHVDENILRLAIAINADGCYVPTTTLNNNKGRTSRNTRFTDKDTSNRDCYIISVKKERKKDRIRLLLKNANIEYKESYKGEYSNFTFHFPFNPKHFPKEWYHLDEESKHVFIDEIFYWDGSLSVGEFSNGRTSTRKTYSTSKKDDADLVQFIFKTSGYGTYFRTDSRETQKDNYQIALTKITQTKLSNKTSYWSKYKSNNGDRCYCFQVESGMLVARRHNKVFISGNCGTLNLTRDYRFGELYCSTLEQGELDQASDYNKEAVKFQFDFLNDGLEKLPKSLLDALKSNKPIVFFLNPPYATAANGKADSNSKKDVAKTITNSEMVAKNFGNGSRNLYAQFLYRITEIKKQFNLTNCHIALFSPTLFLSGPSYREFRKYYLNEFAFDNAIQFKASHFADVADNWGISFSLWHNGITENKNDFEYTLTDSVEGEIVEQGKKIVYNTDGLVSASDWAKANSDFDKIETIYLTSAVKIKDSDKFTAYTYKGSLGGFVNSGNNVDKNAQSTYLTTGSISTATGAITHILPDNFDRCTTLFAARKLIEKNWVNSKDEYLAPNTNHEKWDEFVNDSIIYSLFHSSSNQSSLRNVEYKDKKWDIKNEFFWRSASEMAELANACGNDEMYNDARTSSDRYVYKKLQDITLSPEAQAVLDKANEILDKTVSRRMVFNAEHPEYQVCNWDCGWYQIKAMATKDELKEFKVVFDKLSAKMRPMVYELGFLK